jgi:hypothetical protein
LSASANPPGTTDTGSVDDPKRSPVPRENSIDGIASRSRLFADNHAFFSEQPIDQRGLARVWTTYECDCDLASFGGNGGRGPGWRQRVHDRIEQIPYADAVLGSDLEYRIEAELVHLESSTASPAIVDFVDRQQRRLSGFTHGSGDLAIATDQPLAPIHNEHKEIGISNRTSAAFQHELVKWVFARAEHPTSICELESRSLPLDRLRKGIARRAWDRCHDRSTCSRQAVEQRRFPHIWAADEHDGGQRAGHFVRVVDRLSDLFL